VHAKKHLKIHTAADLSLSSYGMEFPYQICPELENFLHFLFSYFLFVHHQFCTFILSLIYIFVQDWNMECKDLESRRQIGEFENGNEEE
jgi:hypothetical protein